MVVYGVLVCTLSIGNTAYAENSEGKYIEINNNNVNREAVCNVVDIGLGETTIRIGISKEINDVEYKIANNDVEVSSKSNETNNISVGNILNQIDDAKKQIEEEKRQAEIEEQLKKNTYVETQNQGGLIDISNPDNSYTGTSISLDANNRYIVERLVMGEAGNQGFIGAALVAQCIRDRYVMDNYTSIDALRINCGYTGKLDREPNQDVINAVNYIFDQGGYAVKHRILYFYSPANMRSGYSAFHESQNHIVTYIGHKFFDKW